MRIPGTPHARAGIVFLNESTQQLLLGYRENHGKIYYTVPGGEIEPNEDAEAAARREFTEETNLVAGEIFLVATYPNPLDPDQTEHLYSTREATGTFDPTVDPDRMLPTPQAQVWDIRWTPLADLPNLPLLPDTAKQALLSYLHL